MPLLDPDLNESPRDLRRLGDSEHLFVKQEPVSEPQIDGLH
jgi:hypothetical protein